VDNRNQYSELWEMARDQFENNNVAHSIVKVLAYETGQDINREFIMRVLGHWALLDVLLAGQIKFKERCRALESSEIQVIIPMPIKEPEDCP
jgi:hypothetical protein